MSDAQNIEGLPDWGPAMRALDNDKHRAFVCALFDAPGGAKGQLYLCTKAAGFGTATSSRKSLSVIAQRLLGNALRPALAAQATGTR